MEGKVRGNRGTVGRLPRGVLWAVRVSTLLRQVDALLLREIHPLETAARRGDLQFLR